MKFVIIFTLIAAVYAAPTSIQDNNIGDIVNVNIDANLDVANNIDLTSVDVSLIWRNLQAILLGGDRNGDRDGILGGGNGDGLDPIQIARIIRLLLSLRNNN
jgi:hypothetical protein